MTIKASIDIGSNSVLLLVADMTGGQLKELERCSEVTSLGKGLDKTGVFAEDTMAATLTVLQQYKEICTRYGIAPVDIIITATEASRVAGNSVSFYQRVKDQLGMSVKIITGAAEAALTARGILHNSTFVGDTAVIMDVGGASTELIRVKCDTGVILESISMPVGSVRATEWLNEGTFVKNLQKIFGDFRIELDKYQTKRLYCVAGTATSLGNMHLERKDFVEDDVHGTVVGVVGIDKLFKNYSDTTPEVFLDEFPFLGKRSASIRGGLHIFYHILHRLLVEDIQISTYGLRYGSLLEGGIKDEYLA